MFLIFEFVSTDIHYKRKVIKLFEEVVAVMKKSNRGHQTIDFPIETALLQHFHYFEKVLTSNVKLHLQQYNEIEDLNSALANNDLSIAMVSFGEFLRRIGMYILKFKANVVLFVF